MGAPVGCIVASRGDVRNGSEGKELIRRLG